MYGSFFLCGIALFYKPDTTIQTWAMQEARRRMRERGEAFEYVPSPYVRGGSSGAEPAKVDLEEDVPAPTGTSVRLV